MSNRKKWHGGGMYSIVPTRGPAKGVEMYYNRTMALLYNIDPGRIDPKVKPLGLKEMTEVLTSADATLTY